MALKRHIVGALALALAFGDCTFQISYNESINIPTCLTGPRWYEPGEPLFQGFAIRRDDPVLHWKWALNGTINPSDPRVNDDLANFQFTDFDGGGTHLEDQVYFNATAPPYLRIWETQRNQSGIDRYMYSSYQAFKLPLGICKGCIHINAESFAYAPDLIVLNETSGELTVFKGFVNDDGEGEYMDDSHWGQVPPGTKAADVHLLRFPKPYGTTSIVYRDSDGSLVQQFKAPFSDGEENDMSNLTITYDNGQGLLGTLPFTFVDIDGDGREDMVTWNNGNLTVAYNLDNALHLPLNLGDPQELALSNQTDAGDKFDPARPFNTIRFTDLDNDGQPELLLFNGKTQMWDIYASPPTQPLPPSAADFIYFSDLDGDGLDDYVYMGNPDSATFFKNLGGKDLASVRFGPGQNLTLPQYDPTPHPQDDDAGYPQLTFWADMDGNGRSDLILWNDTDSILYVYLNNGSDLNLNVKPVTAVFNLTQRIGTVAFDPMVADIDGDGKADLWWADLGEDHHFTINVLINSGIAWNGSNGTLLLEDLGHNMVFSSQGNDIGGLDGNPFGLSAIGAMADINGDGKADFITLERDSWKRECTWINNLDKANGRYEFAFDSTYSAPGYGTMAKDWKFARLTSNRSDIVLVDPQTGKSYAWPNTCGESPPPPPKNMTNTHFLSTVQKRNTEAGKKVLSPRAFSQQVNYDRYKELVPRDSGISKLTERISASVSRLLHRLRQL